MEKAKKGSLINKTWQRCKSIGRGLKTNSSSISSSRATALSKKSKSWPRMAAVDLESRGRPVAPQGCFSVYVGPERRRFVVKTEHANHPLFRALLEEAESEFGYDNQGPLTLPCNVDVFYKVLLQMDDCGPRHFHAGCSAFSAKRHSSGSYHLLSPPSRMLAAHFQVIN